MDTPKAGRSLKSQRTQYRDFIQTWAHSDRVLAHARAQYAVNGSASCGPAYINDGFDKVNVYFSYNSDLNCMEVRTIGPLLPGIYELLVNYDPPGFPSTYWTVERRKLLPPETLARLESTYPCSAEDSADQGPPPPDLR